jgi:stage IV sporulation protein FB
MGWSFTLGRIAGTSIRLHFTFLLFLAWIGITDYARGGAPAALASIVFILLIFACVTAHEFGHIFMARRYGVKTPEVILSPIGGIANMERIPEVPIQELLVAIAGPLVNVVIAGVILAGTGLPLSGLANLNFETATLAERLAFVNVVLVVFNLIPAFPMDGGRMLRAVLAMWLGAARATALAARLGQGFAFLFVLLGLFYNPILLVVGVFIYFAAASEEQTAAFRGFARGLAVRDAMERSPRSLPGDATLARAVEALLASPQRDFPVIDGAGHPVGLIDRELMISNLESKGPETAVAEVMRPVQGFSEADALEDAVNQMRTRGLKAEVVTGPAGQLTGLLTIENIAEMMMIHTARPGWSFGPSVSRRPQAKI